ncbi:hypothetical protein BY458DRAFT_492680 [Sporodiniella umbellata]|nr:hypothetical protein BY458DRAFT_492680 [Sporodiniella umbellata]
MTMFLFFFFVDFWFKICHSSLQGINVASHILLTPYAHYNYSVGNSDGRYVQRAETQLILFFKPADNLVDLKVLKLPEFIASHEHDVVNMEYDTETISLLYKLLVFRERENSVLLEKDTRLPGNNIDIIICILNLNLDFVLVNVFDPYCDAFNNYKRCRGTDTSLERTLRFNLRLLFQHIHVEYPCFQVVISIKIPVRPILFASIIQRFVSELFDSDEKTDHLAKEAKGLLAIIGYGKDSDSSGTNILACSPPKVYPKKVHV